MADDGTIPDKIGHDARFAELAARVKPGLLAVIQSVGLIGQDQVENIAQEALAKAWRHPGFDPTRPGAANWLRKAALRLTLSWLRSKDSASVSLDVLNAAIRSSGSRDSLSCLMEDKAARDPADEAIRRERAERVHEALQRIPPDQREVLERFYFRGEGTQGEIAASMGISVAAFNSRLNRGRLALKQDLLRLV